MPSDYVLRFFPNGLEAPGHPNGIAFLIMSKYANMAEAMTKTGRNDYAKALTDIDIPGAANNIHMALEVLESLLDLPPEIAFATGNEMWRSVAGDGDRRIYAVGQAQVERIRDLFLEKALTWDPTPHPDPGRIPGASL